MEHKLVCILCVTELKLMTRSHFIEILMILTICIQCQCPVDRVFRNCGVCDSEVLLYIYRQNNTTYGYDTSYYCSAGADLGGARHCSFEPPFC